VSFRTGMVCAINPVPRHMKKIHNNKNLQFIYNYSKYKIALTDMEKLCASAEAAQIRILQTNV
jgi:hypothetical protein